MQKMAQLLDHNWLVLLLAFVLELVGLYAFGLFGSRLTEGFLSVVLAITLPVIAATIWGVFGTVGDTRGNGGKPPVAVSGKIRFAIEIGFFVLGTLAFLAVGATTAAIVFTALWVFVKVVGYERMMWLLRN